VNDGWKTCGYAAELMAVIMEESFFDLDAPIQRVCAADVPMPVATALQKAVMVSEEDIATACRAAMVDAIGRPGSPSEPKETQT
jgi:pyruvate dehydrogenase E1 component beta subunit